MAHRSVEQEPRPARPWWVLGVCVSLLVIAVGGLVGGLGL